jgi:hypothetical protein
MLPRLLVSASLLAASTTALAASDLTTTITPPSPTKFVYQTGRYNVKVSNIGNQTAYSSTVSIQLPETNTSPQVYIMGTLGARSASCALSGRVLNCTLGNINRNKSVTVWFDISLPQSADPIVFVATAATTSTENTTANNQATRTAVLNYYSVPFTGPRTVLNEHCTGTGLAAWFECTLFPGAVSSHTTTFEADGTIWYDYGAGPEYLGDWQQPTASELTFQYYDGVGGPLMAEFVGDGTSSTCWEGLTTFVGSTYVAPYKVCLQ